MTITANRRKFLGAAAAGVLTGATALSAKAACRDPMPAKFDEMHDVVVVGSGFAGLSAALSAKLAVATSNFRRLNDMWKLSAEVWRLPFAFLPALLN